LAPALAKVLVIVLRLLDEEEFLRRDLSGYAEYCEKVPRRLVPGIW
jgi:protein-S-isoprenylcysteine O-methyltransferase Ste14